MPSEHTVKVHFIDGTERIVPAKDIHPVGEEGARRGTALVDGREVPIYKRSEPEWGPLWYEQILEDAEVEKIARDRYRVRAHGQIITLSAQNLRDISDWLLQNMEQIEAEAKEAEREQ